MRKRLLIIALAVTVGATYGLVKTSAALAYGQCGGTVYTGSQLYHAWSKMGVTSQAAGVMRSAGFHRMDNTLSIWMRQRVVRANLARSASPIDYGCNPGNLFSVGHRLLPKGTPLMVVLPAKYSKGEVRESPHKGFHRIVVRVRAAGKSNCSNPENGYVFVYIYVKVVPTHHKVKKPKTVSCSAGYVLQNGSCVSQTQIAENNCKQAAKGYPGSTWSFNSNTLECTIVQVQSNCSTTIVVNGNGNVVNVTTSGNCNSSPPPPPPPAPTYQCTGLSLSMSGLSATAVIGTSVSGGASFKSASINWGDSNSTTGGLNQSHTYAASGTYGVNAVVTFSLPDSTTASADCSASVTIAPPPTKPTITDIYQLNAESIYEGNSYQLCATVQAQAGDSVTVTFATGTPGHPGIGTISQTIFSLSGSGQVCTTYTAPGETGTDTYTVYAHDNTNDTDAVPVSATPWQVQAQSVSP